MSHIRDLTPQERACFEPVDRQMPGSNLVGIAEALAERVSDQTKAKIRRELDDPVGNLLWELQQEHTDDAHMNDHEGTRKSEARQDCMACRIERAIELLGAVTVP